MNDTAEYLLLLMISLALTLLVARLLVRAGEPFLQEVFQDAKVSRAVNWRLSVLFILITSGVVAMLSVLNVNTGSSLQNFVVKLGMVLVVLGIAYGISLLVLIRVRERRRADQISEQVSERLADRGVTPTAPAGGVPLKSAPPIPPLAAPATAPATQPGQPAAQPAAPVVRPAGVQPGRPVPPAQP